MRAKQWNRSDKGATLVIVAGAMIVLLGMSAMAVDLVSAYLARAQAQRAADAAALAGASIFITQGCTTASGGCVTGGPQESLATTQAEAVAGQNAVAGVAPTSSTTDVSFNYPTGEEPQITVTVYRDSAHSDALPTFFGKIFGINSVNVSATATAEAYNPSGGNTSVGIGAVKPFLVPNCDPNHPVLPTDTVHANANCPCTAGFNGCAGTGTGSDDMSYYIYPPSSAQAGQIVNPGVCTWSGTACSSSSGVIGAPWQLHDNAGPSQWYTIAFTSQSGASYRTIITESAPQTVACNQSLNSLNGHKVGPTDQGIQALIHANGDNLNQGQDYMCSPSYPNSGGNDCTSQPFTILGGSNNPYGLSGQTFLSPSDSIASVVVYDGHQLPPGGGTVTVIGYMQLFIQDVVHSGNDDYIDTVVMSIGGCSGGTAPSAPPPVISDGGSFIPIRLIRTN